jgi:hypothetical protein
MNRRYLRTGPLAALCLLLILLSGACDNPANEGDTDMTATAAKTAQDAADSFSDIHSGALALWADTLTLADTDSVNAALEAYQGLRPNARILLAEEKARLDLLKAALDKILAGAERDVYYTLTDVLDYLMEQPESTIDTPCPVAYYGDETIYALYRILAAAGKYVALDLSESGVYGFATGTEAGRELIVSLVLPDTLTATPSGTQYTQLFSGYVNLKTVRAAGLVTLGSYTFGLRDELIAVDLPKVAYIGWGAFSKCISLTTVTLPEVVTTSGSIFADCSSLTTVSLPKAQIIGDSVFSNCISLTSVNLPEAVTIGGSAFAACRNLPSINLPKAATIGGSAFSNCRSLPSINLPKAVTIGGSAFGLCTSLISASLPAVVSLEMKAFDGCASLTSVDLPKVQTIAVYAFQDCASLAAITLPELEFINNNAFRNCASLETVTLGLLPPTIGMGYPYLKPTTFSGAAATPRTITIKVPLLALYERVSPWSDKLGANNNTGGADYFWDDNPDTWDNLTVALEAL